MGRIESEEGGEERSTDLLETAAWKTSGQGWGGGHEALMGRGLTALSPIPSTDGNDEEQQWAIFITGKLSRYDHIYIIIALNKSTQMQRPKHID